MSDYDDDLEYDNEIDIEEDEEGILEDEGMFHKSKEVNMASDEAFEEAGFNPSNSNPALNGKSKSRKKATGFQALGLSKPIFGGIMRMGYKLPTPIQRATLPIALSGKDLVAMARTGSGKTAAFLIPMLEKLKEHESIVGARGVIISPTRELATQTLKFAKIMGKFTSLRYIVILGGESIEMQFEELSTNPDVIIATPGRLMHLLKEVPNFSLRNTQIVIFDEADRLFEMGFAEQLQEIIGSMPEDRQTLLFSATMPKMLMEFARAGLRNPEMVRLDVDTKISENLSMAFIITRNEEKMAALVYLLQNIIPREESTIVFVATRHHVELVCVLLQKLEFKVASIYGALDPTARRINLEKFRNGLCKILVVTDVAARGIDIPLLDNVINFDFPDKPKLFIHRVGRAARQHRRGVAFNLLLSDEIGYMVDLHLYLGKKLVAAGEEESRNSYSIADIKPSEVHYGVIPRSILDDNVESLRLLSLSHVEMKNLYKSCNNAIKLYYKTRADPSKRSIARGKELILTNVHPLFANAMGAEEMKLVDVRKALKNFRPQATVLEVEQAKSGKGVNAMMKMKRVVHQHAITATKKEKQNNNSIMVSNISLEKENEAMEYEMEEEEKEAEDDQGEGLSVKDKQILSSLLKKRKREEEKQEEESNILNKINKKYISKAERKKMKKNGNNIATSPIKKAEIGSPKKKSKVALDSTSYRDSFYMHAVPTSEEYHTEAALSIRDKDVKGNVRFEDALLDLMPDEALSINNKRKIVKWDDRKKKYIKTTVGESKKTKAESSGLNVKKKVAVGEMYDKWMKKNKKDTLIEGGQEGELNDESKKLDFRFGKPKGFVPSAANNGNSVIPNKNVKSELKTANEIRKDRKIKEFKNQHLQKKRGEKDNKGDNDNKKSGGDKRGGDKRGGAKDVRSKNAKSNKVFKKGTGSKKKGKGKKF